MSLPSATACIMRQVSSFSYSISRAKPFINCSANKPSRSRQISHPRHYAIRSNVGSMRFQSYFYFREPRANCPGAMALFDDFFANEREVTPVLGPVLYSVILEAFLTILKRSTLSANSFRFLRRRGMLWGRLGPCSFCNS
jgi:hypothetical protein